MSTSSIAVIANFEGLDSQALLAGAVEDWRASGARVAGVVAEEERDGPCSAGYLCDIASGQKYSIQLAEPPSDTVCHLDSDGVAEASLGLLAQIPEADIVVLAKFGKLEGMERGLWPAFSAAIKGRKPIVTTVSSKHVDALKKSLPEMSWVDASSDALADWWQQNRPPQKTG